MKISLNIISLLSLFFLSNRPGLIEELTWFPKDDVPPLLGISKHMLWQEKLSDDPTDLV